MDYSKNWGDINLMSLSKILIRLDLNNKMFYYCSKHGCHKYVCFSKNKHFCEDCRDKYHV